MTDTQAKEAEAIILGLQAEIEHLHKQLARDGAQGHAGTGKNPLCLGCYQWRLGLAVISGIALAFVAWGTAAQHAETLKSVFGDANAAMFGITAAASLLPLALIVGDWKLRLYKNGFPGVIRAVMNMLDEFKRGLAK